MSPRTPQQFEEIREEKKALIMEVALKYFANEGYHRTTITRIAREAGISKGLMYNYFESKEELLSAIIQKSVYEVYSFFDVNRDGYLSPDEFEYFIRKITSVLKEKQVFWKLFFQLMVQNEVRDRFLETFVGTRSMFGVTREIEERHFVSGIIKTITEYFLRKKETKGPDYDPLLELNMFILTMKGFWVTYIYSENVDDEYFNNSVNRIIEMYK
jgi:AcrR family transcriptional regulator